MSDFWVCPDEGKKQILTLLVNHEDYRLEQFIAGGPVDDDSVVSDFTFASYVGYTPVFISAPDWNAAIITAHVGSIQKTTNPVFACTSGSPQTVMGLVLYGSDSDQLILGVNYATPIVMSPGTTDTISPLKIQDKTFV